jgi:hypothetical protein
MDLLAFLRMGIMLLLAWGFFLNPTYAHISESVSVVEHALPISAHCQSDEFTPPQVSFCGDDGIVLEHKPQPVQSKSWKEKQDDASFVVLTSPRRLGFTHHDPHQCRPNYLLAYEFASPDSPSFCIGYREDFTPSLDWRLSATPKPSKISGWKESNLLYRFSQQIS